MLFESYNTCFIHAIADNGHSIKIVCPFVVTELVDAKQLHYGYHKFGIRCWRWAGRLRAAAGRWGGALYASELRISSDPAARREEKDSSRRSCIVNAMRCDWNCAHSISVMTVESTISTSRPGKRSCSRHEVFEINWIFEVSSSLKFKVTVFSGWKSTVIVGRKGWIVQYSYFNVFNFEKWKKNFWAKLSLAIMQLQIECTVQIFLLMVCQNAIN